MPAARHSDIADDLRRRIEAGEWRPDDVLPRMEDLSAAYGVARGTIAQAVRQLEGEGLVLSVKRRGTVVLRHRQRTVLPSTPVVRRNRPLQGGYSFGATRPGVTWVHHITPIRTEAPIGGYPAEVLGIEPGAMVFRRRRVTSPPDEPPFTLADSWIAPEVVAAAPEVREQGVAGSYFDHIEAVGHGPLSWRQVVRCRLPSDEEAALLKIPTRMPVQEVSRIATSAAAGRPVEITVMVIPGDRVEFISEIERDASAVYEVLSPPGGPHSYKEP